MKCVFSHIVQTQANESSVMLAVWLGYWNELQILEHGKINEVKIRIVRDPSIYFPLLYLRLGHAISDLSRDRLPGSANFSCVPEGS